VKHNTRNRQIRTRGIPWYRVLFLLLKAQNAALSRSRFFSFTRSGKIKFLHAKHARCIRDAFGDAANAIQSAIREQLYSRDNICELNFPDKRNIKPTAQSLLISDCRRPTTSSRRGLEAPGVARGLARAYPYPRPLPPRGDALRTKSDRPRHRRINHNSVSSIKHSLDANFSIDAVFYGEKRRREAGKRGERMKSI